jgi:hypothetical protein
MVALLATVLFFTARTLAEVALKDRWLEIKRNL